MKLILIPLLASCMYTTDVLAQNLVPNPDFETRDADFCGIAFSTDLANSLSAWYSPTSGTPDVYFTDIDAACWNFQPNSTYPGPIGFKGSQLPRSGTSMVGLGTHTIAGFNQREYIQVDLTSPLVPAGKYLVECYVSLGDYTEFASNNLAFHLSTLPPTSGGDGPISVVPQYVSTSVIGETQGWVRVFDTITVTDAYQYLTIGNFNDDASTNLVANPSASGQPGTYGAYYFIDDVRVERVFTDIADVNELSSMDVRIFPNPTADKIHMEFPEMEGEVEMKLLDVNGRVVWSDRGSFINRIVDLRSLQDGVYFIKVESEFGNYSERIVKK